MSAEVPLVVDLDGTLIRSDLLPEAALAFFRAHPLQVWKLPIWLCQGKAVLKENLARSTVLDASVLPCRREILALIEEERKKGRAIILATASHRSFAERVAAHLPRRGSPQTLAQSVTLAPVAEKPAGFRSALCGTPSRRYFAH